MLDNAALFQVNGHGVIVLIMTQGGAFLLTDLFYPNVCLIKKKSTHLVTSPEVRLMIILRSSSSVGLFFFFFANLNI